MLPKVAIIILNWNGWKDTIECLESIYEVDYNNYDVIVVDNASQNDSVNKIIEYCNGKILVKSEFFSYNSDNKPITVLEYTKEEVDQYEKLIKDNNFIKINSNNKIRLILNDNNSGFSGGNNLGIKYALKTLYPDYILLLNNDTVVDKDLLLELVKVAESNEQIGIIGPKINYYNNKIKNFSVGGKINWLTGENFAIKTVSQKQNMDYVSGCALFIKTNLFNKIGLLPTEYFMYAEELDYCVHAKKEGFLIYNCPTTTVWHKISGSSESKFVKYYRTRNRFIFMKKFSSKFNYIFFLIWRLTIDLSLETFILFYRRDLSIYKEYLRGLFDGLVFKTKNINYKS